jgi:serine acetyltransferase
MREQPQGSRAATDNGRAELQLTAPAMSFRQLVWSDYEMAIIDRPDSTLGKVVKFLPRLIFNPSLQLALLVRIAQKGPRILTFPIRWLQVVMFSCEIYGFSGPHALVLGPGVAFPHPCNIIIGAGTKIGAGVTIYNCAQIGTDRHIVTEDGEINAPMIGDRAVIYGYTALQGRYTVGHDAVVGTRVMLDADVPPGALRTINRLRLAGDWPGETRTTWRPPSQSR